MHVGVGLVRPQRPRLHPRVCAGWCESGQRRCPALFNVALARSAGLAAEEADGEGAGTRDASVSVRVTTSSSRSWAVCCGYGAHIKVSAVHCVGQHSCPIDERPSRVRTRRRVRRCGRGGG